MPYKDPEKRKEAQRKSMGKIRGSQKVKDVNPSVNPDIDYIKSVLPEDIVRDIERLNRWFARYEVKTSAEDRWERAYSYHVWDESGRPLVST